MANKARNWSKQKIVDAIQSHHAAGADLTLSRMSRLDSALVAAAVNYFEGWRQAVQAAGIDYTFIRQLAKGHRSRAIVKWTQAAILQEIRRLWELGEDIRPLSVMVRLPGLCTAARKHYGSWAKTLEAANIDPRHARLEGLARQDWVRKWVRVLAAEAAGLEQTSRARPRDYRSALSLADAIDTANWLDQLTLEARR